MNVGLLRAGGHSAVTAVREITIAAKDDIFDALFEATTRFAELEGDTANTAYVAQLDRLRDQVLAASGGLFDPDFCKKHLYID